MIPQPTIQEKSGNVMRKIIGAIIIGIVAAIPMAGTVQAEKPPTVHHPECAGLVKDIAPGVPTPVDGVVYVKAGTDHYNVGFQSAGYVAGPQGAQPYGVSHVDVCPETPTTTAPPTTVPETTTPPTTVVDECLEDEPCWDCETMGNKICGPVTTVTDNCYNDACWFCEKGTECLDEPVGTEDPPPVIVPNGTTPTPAAIELPATGDETRWIAAVGLLLIAIGAAIRRLAR
jgi:LPXTG-motif cell wall-anchored protein